MENKGENINYGYIYIRTNEYWDTYYVVKLGKTTNIPDREKTYITNEIRRGKFIMVIEINLDILDKTEKKLQKYFNSLHLHVKDTGGIEFYKKEIITLMIPYFNNKNIKYRILADEEINELTRKQRNETYIYESSDDENSDEEDGYGIHYDGSLENGSNDIIYTPRDYQDKIIENACKYFENNNKGLLIIPCGVGKTLISLWITEKLNLHTILIGVPNRLLLKQWNAIVCNLFGKHPYLIVKSGIQTEYIKDFLNNNKNKCIVISTYSSAYKIYNATKDINFKFDMKINDETHHLTTNNIELLDGTKKYIEMLNISSHKQLSLTATVKNLENSFSNVDNKIISNDNIYHFGNIIEKKSLLWAINNEIVCDYIIQTIMVNNNEFEKIQEQLKKIDIMDDNEKRLFLSSYAALKSINENYSHHILIYANNMENTIKIIRYIKLLLENEYFNIPDLYYSNYHSNMNAKMQYGILDNYNKVKYGIISCVYCLGEGYDNNKIDAVVFAENMSSNIRIVQSALRASRKNKAEENKITKIILPVLYENNWFENNNNEDLGKIKKVIYQIGLEDETIIQKIKVYRVDIKKHNTNTTHTTHTMFNMEEYNKEYNEELTQILKLKTINREEFAITYQKAKKIIAKENIKNKEDYYKLCDRDIRLSKEPERLFKKDFKGWIDYLSIERIYYDFDTCRRKINEYLLLYPELRKHNLNLSYISAELCKIDNLFPPFGLWAEYYDKDNIDKVIILNIIKKQIII